MCTCAPACHQLASARIYEFARFRSSVDTACAAGVEAGCCASAGEIETISMGLATSHSSGRRILFWLAAISVLGIRENLC